MMSSADFFAHPVMGVVSTYQGLKSDLPDLKAALQTSNQTVLVSNLLSRVLNQSSKTVNKPFRFLPLKFGMCSWTSTSPSQNVWKFTLVIIGPSGRCPALTPSLQLSGYR